MRITRYMLFSALLTLLLSVLLFVPCALCAEEEEDLPAYPPLPALSDPMDQQMQQLGTIYQKDPRFKKLLYDQTYFSIKGCAPSSISNAVIAAFGVTDPNAAEQIVQETLRILCPGQKYGRKPIDQSKLSTLLSPEKMAESAEKYPALAASVGSYAGTIDFTLDKFDLDLVLTAIENHRGEDYMTTGRIGVRDSWEDALRCIYALHDAGLDDAVLILAYAGAGTASGTAPLRTSSSGHYLTLYIPVGPFMSSSTIYVLDSLPRALFDEEYRPGLAYRSCYAFVEEEPDSKFNRTFTTRRISPTIIRSDLNEAAQQQLAGVQDAEERIAVHNELMSAFQVYSTCTALLKLTAQ